MARRKKKEEHINHERWLVSYADFITLLFAFFTSLYAISTVDAKKAGKMVFSTRAAFNTDFFPSDQPVLGHSSPVGAVDLNMDKGTHERVVPDVSKAKRPGAPSHENRVQTKTLTQLLDEMTQLIDVHRLGDNVRVKFINNNMVVSLNDVAFFAPGTATLRPESLPVLDKIAERIVQMRLNVRVEGHTDDSPPVKGPYKTNWELSVARSVSVVQYLIDEYATPPETLSVAGFASSRPIDSNQSAAGRAANRRIDIVLLSQHP